MSVTPTLSAMPEHGEPRDAVLARLDELAAGDVDWRSGTQQGVVYWPGDDVVDLAHEAYGRFYHANALLHREFPSMARIQSELLAAAGDLFHQPAPTGVVTTGGTESNLLVAWSALQRARRLGLPCERPNVVAPFSAHPSFDKAAKYLGLEVRRTPLRDDWSADPAAMRDAVSPDTVLLVASAPGYAHGVVDPIEEIGAIAERTGVPLHVDGALGGFMLPFVERLGRPVPTWDFRVAGVASITADLHKHGYAPKGVSVLMLRDEERLGDLAWDFEEWPGGHYGTQTITGSRSGGALAGAWAVFRYLGQDGFLRVADDAMTITDGYLEAVRGIASLEVLGRPTMNKFGFRSRELPSMAIADGLEARGWRVMRQGPPLGISMHLQPYHRDALDRYAGDLSEVCALVRRGSITDSGRGASYT